MVVLFSGVEAFDVVVGEEVEPGLAGGGVGDDDVEGVERGDVDEGDLVDLAAVEDENLLLRAAKHRLLCLRAWNSDESVTPASRSMPLQDMTAVSTW